MGAVTVYLLDDIYNYVGLAADVKPTAGMPIGSRFLEADTPAEFMYVGDYFAGGVLTIAAVSETDDEIDIGATNYVFVDDGTASSDGEINDGLTAAASVANIVAAINGTDGVNTANPDVTAVANGATIVLTAIVAEATTAQTVYTNQGLGTNAFADATLVGGQDQWQALP